ncbi:MAG TPA: sugar phosphate nucleotidyltransferase, partial [Chthoniobacteraceae bacterium]|nr:sugar phosphate nucleotidyltransferase [Chthoniobacteraceae bacterium]
MPARPLFVLVLAGGSGERFWPLSRKSRPKQLLSLFSKETLLEATLRRLDGLVPPAQTLILTNAEQEAAVRALCPQLPRENIVAEPAKRDTAAAIALGAGWISMRAPDATMIVLPADHLIQDTDGFQRTLRAAV